MRYFLIARTNGWLKGCTEKSDGNCSSLTVTCASAIANLSDKEGETVTDEQKKQKKAAKVYEKTLSFYRRDPTKIMENPVYDRYAIYTDPWQGDADVTGMYKLLKGVNDSDKLSKFSVIIQTHREAADAYKIVPSLEFAYLLKQTPTEENVSYTDIPMDICKPIPGPVTL